MTTNMPMIISSPVSQKKKQIIHLGLCMLSMFGNVYNSFVIYRFMFELGKKRLNSNTPDDDKCLFILGTNKEIDTKTNLFMCSIEEGTTVQQNIRRCITELHASFDKVIVVIVQKSALYPDGEDGCSFSRTMGDLMRFPHIGYVFSAENTICVIVDKENQNLSHVDTKKENKSKKDKKDKKNKKDKKDKKDKSDFYKAKYAMVREPFTQESNFVSIP